MSVQAVLTRLVTGPGRAGSVSIQQAAFDLAQAMPRLALEARRVAGSVFYGLHGRRRPGSGENFWQFRRFVSGEAAGNIDWRRSARGQELYVREHELDTAHTLWLWVDRSASMNLVSSLAQTSKLERALVICLALADLLVQGGERVGVIGLADASAHRAIVEKLAQAFLSNTAPSRGVPSPVPLASGSEAILIGDFLGEIEEFTTTIDILASRGARGHIVMIADPVEEIFPFAGLNEFIDPENGQRLLTGRAQDLQAAYENRLKAHRDMLKAVVLRYGWTFSVHRTDKSASQAVLALHPLLREGAGL